MQATQEGLLQVEIHLLLCFWWNMDMPWEEPEMLLVMISEKKLSSNNSIVKQRLK